MHFTGYDTELQASLTHLTNYPKLLPFFGSLWEHQNVRLLIIAESHYLHKDSLEKSCSDSWYNGNQSRLSKDDLGYINTRGIVSDADLNKYWSKGHSIFYNIKSAYNEAYSLPKSKSPVFQNLAYYNYFQRPAEANGKSIKNDSFDDRLAYRTLTVINRLANPNAIIFVSKLAYNSFLSIHTTERDPSFFKEKVRIVHVPHPSSAWWNRPSKVYGKPGKPISGKMKFINTIQRLNEF